MIVEIENDIIKLKGVINKNLWPATLAAAEMIREAGYKNIIVDCSEIKSITQQGLETFANAFNYLSKIRMHLFFVSVNDEILTMAKSLPGIRSSMPIGESVEEIRASIEIDKISDWEPDKKYMFFLVLGNPSHAIIFADLYEETKKEINFIYPMIIPMKYNLYQPITFLENKAMADLNRLEGFCIFLNRQIKSNIFRVRSYKRLFEKIKLYRNSLVFLSFAGCDLNKNQNREKLSDFVNSDLKGLLITEPKTKLLFFADKIYKKILVYVNDDKEYNRRCLEYLSKIATDDTFVEFVKLIKLKFNETPKDTVDYIEDFNKGQFNSVCKTVNVRVRNRYLNNYVKNNNVDFLIVPMNKGDVTFAENMIEGANCVTLFVK